MTSAVISARFSTDPGQVAQLAEHAAENRGVGSSILPLATTDESARAASGRCRPREKTAMSKVVVFNSVTLDGVMQAPGRADEDRRGGFEHGGWALPYFDPVMGSVAAEGMATGGGLLFGRRTYEDFYSFWPSQKDNPFTQVLNDTQKYVASTTLKEPLPWSNSTLLEGDAADAVARLKQEPGNDLVVLGSGELIRSLMRRNLIDEYVLSIHPLVLGSGRRLFTDGGAFAALRLVDTKTTTTGVVMATYRTVQPEEGKTT
jgi:dihydrofolate reductase